MNSTVSPTSPEDAATSTDLSIIQAVLQTPGASIIEPLRPFTFRRMPIPGEAAIISVSAPSAHGETSSATPEAASDERPFYVRENSWIDWVAQLPTVVDVKVVSQFTHQALGTISIPQAPAPWSRSPLRTFTARTVSWWEGQDLTFSILPVDAQKTASGRGPNYSEIPRCHYIGPRWDLPTGMGGLSGVGDNMWSAIGPSVLEVARLAYLPEDWDGYGAASPSWAALEAAADLLYRAASQLYSVVRNHVRPDSLGAIADGGVGLDWDGPGRRELNVEISDRGELAYLFRDRFSVPEVIEAHHGVSARDIIALILRTVLPEHSGGA